MTRSRKPFATRSTASSLASNTGPVSACHHLRYARNRNLAVSSDARSISHETSSGLITATASANALAMRPNASCSPPTPTSSRRRDPLFERRDGRGNGVADLGANPANNAQRRAIAAAAPAARVICWSCAYRLRIMCQRTTSRARQARLRRREIVVCGGHARPEESRTKRSSFQSLALREAVEPLLEYKKRRIAHPG